jgi:phosphoglycerol transferase
MPAGSMVFQLPYLSYPENPAPAAMQPYSHLRAYLHSTTLRWSYPDMRGRLTDWPAQLDKLPITDVVRAVAAAGFTGLYVDENGYDDRGAQLQGLLAPLLGPPSVVSKDGTLVFWDLRNFVGRLHRQNSPARLAAARAATLYPLRVGFGSGFYGFENGGGQRTHWARRRAWFSIDNRASYTRRMTFTATVATPTRSRVTFRWPDGSLQTITASNVGTRIRRQFVLRPGPHQARIDTDAPRVPGVPRDLHVAIINPHLPRNPAFDLKVAAR